MYGASIADAKAFGFHELDIPNQRMKELGGSAVQILAGVMKDEAVDLFRDWQARPDSPDLLTQIRAAFAQAGRAAGYRCTIRVGVTDRCTERSD